MNADDRRSFGEIVAMLARTYDRTADAALIASWWSLMQDWTVAEFDAAARQLACEPGRTRMPTPGEFAALRQRASRLSADDAWPAIVLNVRTSAYRRGELAAPAGSPIDRAIHAIGGYQAIGRTNEDELHFVKARFAAALDQLSDTDAARAALPNHVARLLPRLGGTP